MELHDFRLSTRITVITLLIVAVGAAAFFFLARVHHREIYISQENIDLEKNLQAEKNRLIQAIDTLRLDVSFLSNTPPISGAMHASLNHGYDARDGSTSSQWGERLNKSFLAFAAAHPDYYLVRYIAVADGGKELVRVENRDGHIGLAQPAKLGSKGIPGGIKAFSQLQEGQIGLSGFELSLDIGDPPKRTLRAAAPLFTPSKELFGMVIVNYDVSHLLEAAASSLRSGTQAYMANGDGQYLLHPDAQRAFKLAPGSTGEITADFPFIKTMFDPRETDYLSLQDLVTKAGRYAAASRIPFDTSHPERFLLLMYHIPDAAVASHIAPIAVEYIVAGFIAMLLIGWIALLALRRAFLPLEQVAVAANKIAAGDQNITLPKIGGGEIGSLTDALDAMMGKLRQREKLLRESETRYRRLHESMMDAFVLVDMSGRLLESNHVFRKMLGYSADELQGMAHADLTPEKWHDLDARVIAEQVIPQGYSQVYGKEYIRKDGTALPVELKIFLLRNADKQPEAIWAIVRDITERKQTEEALRQGADRIEVLLNSVAEGIYGVDRQGKCTFINSAGLQLLGYQDETELIGKHMHSLIHHTRADGSHYPAAECRLYGCLKSHENVHVDDELFWRKEGSSFPVDYWSRPIKLNGEGCAVITFLDIAERKLAEDALRESESRYRLLVESSPFCIHEIDLDGRLQSMNKAGLDMLCVDDPKKICGMPYLGAVSQQDAGRIGALLWDAINNGTPSHFEFASAGEVPLYFRSCFTPIRDAGGKVLKLMGITEDITERKAAEEMLRFHSNILTSLMEGIYLIRASDGIIVFNNPQFERLFGYGPGELLGKHVSIVNAPGEKSPEAAAAEIISELARAGVWSGEVQNIRKDGTTFWCHASVSAFDHPQFGHVWVSVHEDITARKQFEEMRAKMVNAGRFNIAEETAASLTHELSQPLTACNNYLDVCLRRIDDKDWGREKLKETLQLAYKQAGRAGEIINRFKKQMRRPTLEYTLFDVNLLVKDVMAFLADEIKRQGISIHLDLFSLPEVTACREEIRQVLLSLCENAIEAMHSSLQRELYLTTRSIGSGHVRVGVRDSGEGVLPAGMKMLFEPFQTSREGGLGLSLSICRSIIEKHGGRIWADTERASGAEFYFTLPIKAHHE